MHRTVHRYPLYCRQITYSKLQNKIFLYFAKFIFMWEYFLCPALLEPQPVFWLKGRVPWAKSSTIFLRVRKLSILGIFVEKNQLFWSTFTISKKLLNIGNFSQTQTALWYFVVWYLPGFSVRTNQFSSSKSKHSISFSAYERAANNLGHLSKIYVMQEQLYKNIIITIIYIITVLRYWGCTRNVITIVHLTHVSDPLRNNKSINNKTYYVFLVD
jgi:hypothetical protein